MSYHCATSFTAFLILKASQEFPESLNNPNMYDMNQRQGKRKDGEGSDYGVFPTKPTRSFSFSVSEMLY